MHTAASTNNPIYAVRQRSTNIPTMTQRINTTYVQCQLCCLALDIIIGNIPTRYNAVTFGLSFEPIMGKYSFVLTATPSFWAAMYIICMAAISIKPFSIFLLDNKPCRRQAHNTRIEDNVTTRYSVL